MTILLVSDDDRSALACQLLQQQLEQLRTDQSDHWTRDSLHTETALCLPSLRKSR